MGVMHFALPTELDPNTARGLARSYIVGGPEAMPGPSEARVEKGELLIQRPTNESGALCAPWPVQGNGQLMLTTATLIERDEPYQLLVELARGKVNQLRCQANDWELGGLQTPPEFATRLRDVGAAFARLVCRQEASDEVNSLSAAALGEAVGLGEKLVDAYVEQVFAARHLHQAALDTTLSCTLAEPPATAQEADWLKATFHAVRVPLSWADIESAEAQYHWERTDAVVQWAKTHGLEIHTGPVVDFSRRCLPEWLGLWKGDHQGLSNLVLDYLEAALQRYKDDIRVWQLTAASNCPDLLGLDEDESLNLNARMTEMARQVDGRLHLSVGIAQPWGEYLARNSRAYSPFTFCDTLLRTRMIVNALDLEIVSGVQGRGSLEHDLLDVSRLLDLYGVLGLPVRVTLGCPSQAAADPLAAAEFGVDVHGAGSPPTLREQASWARRLAHLAACKPYVVGLNWTHWSDQHAHAFAHCGLVDQNSAAKPALQELQFLRRTHLR